jgi:hypothetical protein
MATTQKAVDLARDIAAELTLRLSAMTVTSLTHTDGHPYITVTEDATPASGEGVVIIKVRPMAWPLATDVLGNAAQVYSPTVIQVCTEKNYAGATDNVVDNLTLSGSTSEQVLLPVLGTCLAKGCIFEWYVTDYGTVPAIAEITSANLKASFKDLFWDFKKAQ